MLTHSNVNNTRNCPRPLFSVTSQQPVNQQREVFIRCIYPELSTITLQLCRHLGLLLRVLSSRIDSRIPHFRRIVKLMRTLGSNKFIFGLLLHLGTKDILYEAQRLDSLWVDTMAYRFTPDSALICLQQIEDMLSLLSFSVYILQRSRYLFRIQVIPALSKTMVKMFLATTAVLCKANLILLPSG